MLQIDIGQISIENGIDMIQICVQLQKHTDVILYVYNETYLCMFDPKLGLRPEIVDVTISDGSYCFVDIEDNTYWFSCKKHAESFCGEPVIVNVVELANNEPIPVIEEDKKEENLVVVEIPPKDEEDTDSNTDQIDLEGEPIIDVVEDVLNDNTTPIIMETPVSVDCVKIVRIISPDNKSIVEIYVPDKPSYEITKHTIY